MSGMPHVRHAREFMCVLSPRRRRSRRRRIRIRRNSYRQVARRGLRVRHCSVHQISFRPWVWSRQLGSGAGKLDIVEDDDRLASRLAGILIGPGILVIAAGNVDGGALLELHLFDALAEVAEGLDVDVDPAGIVLGILVIDSFADAEADDIAVLGILEGCTVVEASGDHGIGCGKT